MIVYFRGQFLMMPNATQKGFNHLRGTLMHAIQKYHDEVTE